MKAITSLMTVCLCAGLSLSAAAQNSAAQKKDSLPDIFLVTIDTLRADHVHCYGYDRVQTPALDALASDGIRFTQAFTPSPITNTSHTSILTGLLPGSHGVTDFAVPLSPAHLTWAEILRASGYKTAAFIGAVILDSRSLAPGLDRGFDFYDNFPEHSKTKSRWGRIERRGLDVAQHAETWLRAHPQGPHFVWVHFYDPHDPYEPPPPYSQIYKDHLYDGEIAYADSALGNFVAYLKKSGRYDKALIVVVGDHGEGLGEHHEETHGIFLYDSTTHVPLILKLPSRARGKAQVKVVEPQVRTIDILPTALEVAGISSATKFDGEPLQPFFSADKVAPERTAFGETDYPLRFGWAPLRSVRRDGAKFIEAPRPEFYDLRQDAAEVHNLYEPWSEPVKKFRGLLAEVRAKESAAQGDQSKAPGAVTQGTMDELTALGYFGRADAGSATNVPEPSMLPDPKDKIEEQNLLHRAMMESEDGRDEAARDSLERVLQTDPESHAALRQLGELELRAGDYAKSAQHLKRALAIHADDANTEWHAGQAFERIGDLAAARDALEASLHLMPGQPDARALLGQVYLALHNPKAAEDQFAALLLLQPGNVDAKIERARALIAEHQLYEAVADLEPLAQSKRANAEVFELLAEVYSGLGRAQEAQRAEARARLLRSAK